MYFPRGKYNYPAASFENGSLDSKEDCKNNYLFATLHSFHTSPNLKESHGPYTEVAAFQANSFSEAGPRTDRSSLSQIPTSVLAH